MGPFHGDNFSSVRVAASSPTGESLLSSTLHQFVAEGPSLLPSGPWQTAHEFMYSELAVAWFLGAGWIEGQTCQSCRDQEFHLRFPD
jgi:hypothetical protein